MTSKLTLDADALARHDNGSRWLSDRRWRPVGYRLDSDGYDVSVELPGPAVLAAMLTAPGLDLYRRGQTIVARPTGSDVNPEPLDVNALAADLHACLSALPARPDAGRPYIDLRAAALARSPRLAEYARDVVRALRSTLSTAPAAPRVSLNRGPAMTPTERKRAQRERNRLAETASALWWLHEYLTDEELPTEPGSPILAPALYDLAVYALEDFAGEPIDEHDEDSPLFRPPHPMTFYRVADGLLGPRKRTKHGHTYTTPEVAPAMTRTTKAIVESAARLLAAEARAELEALARVSPTGADGLAPAVRLRAV